MRVVWVLDVKKVAFQQSGPLTKIQSPQADKDRSKLPENVYKKTFNSLIIWFKCTIWLSQTMYLTFLDYINAHKTAKYMKKKTYICLFDPLRRSPCLKLYSHCTVFIVEPDKFYLGAVEIPATRYTFFQHCYLNSIPLNKNKLLTRGIIVSYTLWKLNYFSKLDLYNTHKLNACICIIWCYTIRLYTEIFYSFL